MTLPDFIVVGAAKAGTTALYWYLADHPQVFMSRVKETNYFAYGRDEGGHLLYGDPELHHFPIRTIDAYERSFEGAGDALFCGDTLFAGYRQRSDAGTLQEVGAMLGCRVIPLELIDPYYYHLDTCFCPLSPGEAIYFPGAFDQYGFGSPHRHHLATHLAAFRS